MKKRFFFVLVITIFTHISPQADWTIVNYMQSDNDLFEYILDDINAMALCETGTNLNLLVQIDNPEDYGTYRYKVSQNQVVLEEFLFEEMGLDVLKEVIEAFEWGQTKYPAQHYMLVLSGHGTGIIDPSKQKGDKGILFDYSDNTYMNNQELDQALYTITHKLLDNKKIEIIGMDACLMACLEIAYQIKEYADILVSSQESEHAQGWHYAGFLPHASTRYCNPTCLAGNIVEEYETYYHDKNNYYTQSAINLHEIETLKENVDLFVTQIQICYTIDAALTKDIITCARNRSLEFSFQDYIDLYSFYTQLLYQIAYIEQFEGVQETYKTSIAPIKQTLENGKQIIKKCVIKNIAGGVNNKAQGISIYFPKHTIHSSYPKTKFAQDSTWLAFLEKQLITL